MPGKQGNECYALFLFLTRQAGEIAVADQRYLVD